jgi:hypothetical protein
MTEQDFAADLEALLRRGLIELEDCGYEFDMMPRVQVTADGLAEIAQGDGGSDVHPPHALDAR